MKGRALLLYHSASGNTRWVADRLAAALSACGMDAAPRSIAPQPDTADLASFDLVGFGCPIMGFRPSFALSRFVQYLPMQQHKPAFTFSTYLAGVLANSAWMHSRTLHDRGFVVVAHAHFRGEVSWPIARAAGLIVNRGLPNDTLIPSISRFAGTLAELLVRHNAGVLSRPVPFSRSWLNPILLSLPA